MRNSTAPIESITACLHAREDAEGYRLRAAEAVVADDDLDRGPTAEEVLAAIQGDDTVRLVALHLSDWQVDRLNELLLVGSYPSTEDAVMTAVCSEIERLRRANAEAGR